MIGEALSPIETTLPSKEFQRGNTDLDLNFTSTSLHASSDALNPRSLGYIK
jgi:hypothetical protein